MIVTAEQWQAARTALDETSAQFAELITATPQPGRNATLDWSVAETAAHVVVVSSLAMFIIRPEPAAHPFPDLQDQMLSTHVDSIAELNELMLARFTERDPQALAQRLRDNVAEILASTSDLDPATPVQWIGDARLPLAGLIAHLLNELLVHGRDIAGATKTTWVIPPERAALFFELFLFGLTELGYGSLMDHGVPAPNRRIAVQFRSKYTAPTSLVLNEGRIVLAAPDRSDDVRVSFDPATLILMMFGRVSKARAVLTGKVSVAGPRPWLLPGFLKFMHLPGRGAPRTTSQVSH